MKKWYRYSSLLLLVLSTLLLLVWCMAALGWITRRANPLTLVACILLMALEQSLEGIFAASYAANEGSRA